jgi:hypothetical protein
MLASLGLFASQGEAAAIAEVALAENETVND